MNMQVMQTKIKKFLQPDEILKEIPLAPGMVVADLGSGNGYYTVAAGVLVGKKGHVYAADILEEALSQTASLARMTRLNNISTHQCDLEAVGSCSVPETSCDLVILGSILHQVENKDNVIREAYRVLKTGGKLLVIEWKKDAPLGPAQETRISRDEVASLLETHGLRPGKELPAGSFHYALVYEK